MKGMRETLAGCLGIPATMQILCSLVGIPFDHVSILSQYSNPRKLV